MFCKYTWTKKNEKKKRRFCNRKQREMSIFSIFIKNKTTVLNRFRSIGERVKSVHWERDLSKSWFLLFSDIDPFIQFYSFIKKCYVIHFNFILFFIWFSKNEIFFVSLKTNKNKNKRWLLLFSCVYFDKHITYKITKHSKNKIDWLLLRI